MRSKEDINRLLDELLKAVDQISILLRTLKSYFIIEENKGHQKEFFCSDTFAYFQAFTKDGYYGKLPTDNEWNTLEGLFRVAFPRYHQFIAVDHHLTRDQLRLCLLMRLSFSHYVMARIMGVDSKRVTRLKAQVNYRLFSERCARTLENNLKLYY